MKVALKPLECVNTMLRLSIFTIYNAKPILGYTLDVTSIARKVVAISLDNGSDK